MSTTYSPQAIHARITDPRVDNYQLEVWRNDVSDELSALKAEPWRVHRTDELNKILRYLDYELGERYKEFDESERLLVSAMT